MKKPDIDDLIVKGQELMKYCSEEDVQTIQDKVDKLKDRYTDMNISSSEQVSKLEEALPLAEKFSKAQKQLQHWLQKVEPELRGPEPTGTEAEKCVEVIS